MLAALALAVLLWIGGGRLGWPRQARLITLALLYVGILALSVALGGRALGASAGEWLVAGGLVAAVAGYRALLGRIRAHVRPENRPEARPDAPAAPGAFAPGEIDRYARHVVLREIGGMGQRRLKEARVLVIGAGGLGAPTLLYLAGAGVGTLGIIDPDDVEATNLQRQVIHTDARIGMPKVFSAERALRALNPFVQIRPYHRPFTAEIGADLVAGYDLVLDGCDDPATRRAVNAACVASGVPLVSGALSPWEGQISTFAGRGTTPCYACVFPEPPAPGSSLSCAEAGVFGPLPGIVGSMMAAEAIRELLDVGEGLRGRLDIHDALWGTHRRIAVARRPDCAVCRDR